ncbi:MAG: ATP synthase F1 subunit epsilon [Oligoflexales bacterium]
MEGAFKVKILSPEKPLANLEASILEAPGSEGQLGILPGHAALLTALQPGILKVVNSTEQQDFHYFVSGGYLQVSEEHATVMVEVIESPEQIDHERVLQAEKRAMERLAKTTNKDIDIGRALVALTRARARKSLLKITKKGIKF